MRIIKVCVVSNKNREAFALPNCRFILHKSKLIVSNVKIISQCGYTSLVKSQIFMYILTTKEKYTCGHIEHCFVRRC